MAYIAQCEVPLRVNNTGRVICDEGYSSTEYQQLLNPITASQRNELFLAFLAACILAVSFRLVAKAIDMRL